ncbi:MAG: hypothetical protein V4475_07855 [Pseudomonadota bacterium]
MSETYEVSRDIWRFHLRSIGVGCEAPFPALNLLNQTPFFQTMQMRSKSGLALQPDMLSRVPQLFGSGFWWHILSKTLQNGLLGHNAIHAVGTYDLPCANFPLSDIDQDSFESFDLLLQVPNRSLFGRYLGSELLLKRAGISSLHNVAKAYFAILCNVPIYAHQEQSTPREGCKYAADVLATRPKFGCVANTSASNCALGACPALFLTTSRTLYPVRAVLVAARSTSLEFFGGSDEH